MSESSSTEETGVPEDLLPVYPVEINVPLMLNDFQPVHIIPDLMEEDMEILLNIPGMRARIGLNETALTRALGRGDFALAERIIEEATDPEFLNDGALAATPLNIVLSGRSSFFHQPRNLKLAQLLLQRGANANLRIPNHDMESASEAPLELLLRYYLRLLEVFGGPGHCRTSYRPSSMEETELMDTVGLHGELGGLGPMQMVAQTRQLLVHFLENGGDTNLPTTDAAKTIYHMALTATVPDRQLVIRMVELGANVNSADLHNTTPLMDVVLLGSEARCCEELELLQTQGKGLLLDTQNCSLQSVLWRSMFQGHRRFSRRLLSAGASGGCSARVERVTGRPPVPQDLVSSVNLTTTVPSLLAPLLNDSPCTSQLHANFPKHRNGRVVPEFSVLRSLHCVRTHLSPLVDSGHMSGQDTAARLGRLVRSHTSHNKAADDSVVDPVARVQLMYGQITAGLRQLCVRAILHHTLFINKNASDTLDMMEELLKKKGVAKLRVEPSGTKVPGAASYYEYELSNSGRDSSDSEKETPSLGSYYGDRLPTQEIGMNEVVEVPRVMTEVPRVMTEAMTQQHPRPAPTTLGAVSWPSSHSPGSRQRTFPATESPIQTLFPQFSDPTREIVTLREASVGALKSPADHGDEVQMKSPADYGDEIHKILRDCDALEEEIKGTLDLSLEPENMRMRMRLLHEASQLNITESRNMTLDDSPDQTVPDVLSPIEPFQTELILHQSELEVLETQKLILRRSEEELLETQKGISDCEGTSERQKLILRQSEEELLETQKGISLCEGKRTKIDENWSLGSLGELELIGICDKPNTSAKSATPTCDTSQREGASGMDLPSTLEGDEDENRCLRITEHRHSPHGPAPLSPTLLRRRKLSGISIPELVSSSDTEDWDSPSSNPPTPPPPVVWDMSTPPLSAQDRRDSVDNLMLNFKLSDTSAPDLTLTSDSDQESTPSSDTWGGTFSLSCTNKHREEEKDEQPGDATIVSKLTARTLSAIADRLSIPLSLRPCFSVEAARLQVNLLLFNHQSITCDRNCEGDESDSDSEDDWLASDTDHVSDSDTGPRDSDSSDSHFSLRSWFGSTQDGSEGPESSLARADSDSSTDHSWLPDTEEMYRTRQFLAQPAPQFHHSTDSDTESNKSEEPV